MSFSTPTYNNCGTVPSSDPGPGEGDCQRNGKQRATVPASDPTVRSGPLQRLTSSTKKKVARALKVEDSVDTEDKQLWDKRTKCFLERQKWGVKCDQSDSANKKVYCKPSVLSMTRSSVMKKFGSTTKDENCGKGVANENELFSGRGRGMAEAQTPLTDGPTVRRKNLSPASRGGQDEADSFLTPVLEAMQPFPEQDMTRAVEHRPFFTWFIITCHILILFISILTHGFGPWGFTSRVYSKKVLVPSLSLQEVEHSEPSNVWLGPSAAALVRLGAKFAPCMRRDELVFEKIDRERAEEADTACCIRNDESGCVQTVASRCSPLLSTFKKWGNSSTGPNTRIETGPHQFISVPRMSGPVCGQDPRFCDSPASTVPNEWPDDITKWPICTKPLRPHLSEPHMSCEVIGRPCCIGLYGQCHITTQEYCEHVKGHFHEDATLCSQVSCMRDVCGLIPFRDDDRPDQFYRSFLSIFLHAGILHIACTLIFHYIFMRDVERMIGPSRLAIIYVGSGVAGNLASAAFVPYRAEVGPAGSILGVMATCMVVIGYNWEFLTAPYKNLISKLCVTALFFIMGLLFPFIDNYAHLSGFFVGLLLSLILIPYNGIKDFSLDRKRLMIAIGCLFLLSSVVSLILLVWITPIYDCSYCKYFNCLLSIFSDDICPEQDMKVTRVDIL